LDDKYNLTKGVVLMMEKSEKRILAPSTALYPLPVVLVTCGDYNHEYNAITLAWAGVAASEPPTVTIGVRPTRYSYGIIQRYGEFVINLPGAEQVDILAYCGRVSGRNENKFEKAGLTPVRSEYVKAPMVREFPVNIECKVKDRLSLGSHDLFVGNILAVHGNPDVLTGGDVDKEKMKPVAYFYGKYYSLGSEIK
jgi:flavin reductase (DIM6/NTAB) family NADH-FMN oxidoreductase RutF